MPTSISLAFYELGLRIGQCFRCFSSEWEVDDRDPRFRQVVLENLELAVLQMQPIVPAAGPVIVRCYQIAGEILAEIKDFRDHLGDGRQFPTIRSGINRIDQSVRMIPSAQLQNDLTAQQWYHLGTMLGNYETGRRRDEIISLCKVLKVKLSNLAPKKLTHQEDITASSSWPDYWGFWRILDVGLSRLKACVNDQPVREAERDVDQAPNTGSRIPKDVLKIDDARRTITRTDVNRTTGRLLPRDIKLTKFLLESDPDFVSTRTLQEQWKRIGKKAMPAMSTVHDAKNELEEKLVQIYVDVENKSNHGYRLTITPYPDETAGQRDR